MPQLVELKQNRDFIEPEFPGYKLSLQEIPKSTIYLSSKVHIVFPTSEQYTYKHAKLFSLQNHILASETDSLEGTEIIYYIGQDDLIYKIKWDILGAEEVCVNWQIPQGETRQDYNFTMALPDENLAVVSNGGGDVYILDRRNEWKCIFTDTLKFSAVIMDCKVKNNIMHLVMFSIKSNNAETVEVEGKHRSVLNWLQYECTDGIWRQISLQEMQSESELHNVMLSNDFSLYVLSAEGGFINDENNDETKQAGKFTWCQSGDSLSIYIKGTDVNVKSKHIQVKNNNYIVLDGILHGTVDSTMTTWTTSRNGVLEIALCKVDDQEWPELIAGLPMLGECLPNEQIAKIAHEKMSYLCSTEEAETIPTKTATLTDQVEECDFVSSRGAFIERITDGKISHRVMLTQEIIFVDSELGRFAIQQNEDVCLYAAEANEVWQLEHVGTLFALGYIRASKQRRKFTTSAPDLSYSVVAEGTRHVFVYRQNVDVTSGELRHRTSGKRIKQLAQQQVIELEKHDVILGVKATNNHLFVLTEYKAYVFNMKSN